MARILRSLPLFACAFVAYAVWTALPAAARTYNHGTTVLFSDARFGEGDEIRGDLNVVFGNASCSNGAIIDGNVNTFFGNFEDAGCAVGGQVHNAFGDDQAFAAAPWLTPSYGTPMILSENRGLLRHLAFGIVVVFLFLLFPLRVRVALERVEKHPGLSAATGTIALVAVVPIAILLVLSIIGIPLVVVEVAALLAAIGIGQAAVSILIGRRLFELMRPHTTPSPLAALILGLVVVSAAEILPFVGWAVTALVLLIGLGAAILGFVRETSFQSFTRNGPIGGAPAQTAPH